MMVFKFLLLILCLTQLAFSASDPGKLSLMVFEKDALSKDVVIKMADGNVFTPNASGHIYHDLSAGEHEAKVMRNGITLQTVKFSIVAGQETEVIVTLLDKKAADIEVSSPQVDGEASERSLTQVEKSKIVGFVKSFNGDRPLRGARVLVRGFSVEGQTDLNGKFTLDLPLGQYDISVIQNDHVTKTIPLVVDEKGQQALKAPIMMQPSGLQLDDFVVLAPSMNGSMAAMIEVRRSSSNVADVLGAEQMNRMGDGDAGGSLRRVVGLSLVNNQFVYIRGLGERYSSTLFNGANLPSPDPFRKVVPLDLFPTSILESMVVQKSYSADMPAEFGGGSIQIQTKGIPDRKFFNAFVGTNFNTNNSGNYLSYSGGGKDWLGMDDGSRAMPGEIASARDSGRKLVENNSIEKNGFSQEQLADLAKTLPNKYSVNDTNNNVPTNFNMSFGNNYNLGQVRVGHTTSFLYTNAYLNQNEPIQNYGVGENNKLVLANSINEDRTINTINLGAMAGLGLEWRGHSVQYMANVLRRTTNITRVDHSENDDTKQFNREIRQEWTERQLMTNHFTGKHKFPLLNNSKFYWHFSDSKANRSQPDSKYYRYASDNGQVYSYDYTRGDALNRTYSDMIDKANDTKLEVETPIPFIENGFKVKVGFNNFTRDRNSSVGRLNIINKSSTPNPTDMTAPLETIMNNCLKANCLVLGESTLSTDNYKATQRINALYSIVEMPVTTRLKLIAGYRHERSIQNVETFELYSANTDPIKSHLVTNDVLPAHSAILKITEKNQMRFSYSETVSRPDFKELSNSTWIDDMRSGVNVKGNPLLRGAVIKNFDARWEYYPSSQETMSVGVFTKKFKNPIEEVILPGANVTYSFQNAQSAQNRGIELDWRRNLSVVNKALSAFTFGANYAYINSTVTISPENAANLSSSSRPLQGQSPYVANAQLEYDAPNAKFNATLLYNVFGQRIVQVASNGAPDIYEKPFRQLDLILRARLTENTSLNFRAQNLINDYVTSVQGSDIVRQTKRGRNFIVGFNINI